MFQESRFNPNANSYSGAKGVMQFTKATAKLMGLSDTKNVEKSIDAGVRYLSHLRGKFDNSIKSNNFFLSINTTSLIFANFFAEDMNLL